MAISNTQKSLLFLACKAYFCKVLLFFEFLYLFKQCFLKSGHLEAECDQRMFETNLDSSKVFIEMIAFEIFNGNIG